MNQKETTLKGRNPSLSNESHKLINHVSRHCIQFMFKIKKEKKEKKEKLISNLENNI
jgi:hypothetical protein